MEFDLEWFSSACVTILGVVSLLWISDPQVRVCRYNNSKACPTPTSNSAELKDGSSKSDEILSNQLSENATGGFQPCCATSSNSRENMTSLVMGQSEQAAVAFAGPHLGFIPVPGVRFDNIFAGYSHIFPSIFYTKSGLQPAWSPNSSHQKEHHPFPISASVHSNPDVHDSEQVYGRTGEINHNSVDQTVWAEQRAAFGTVETWFPSRQSELQ